MLSRRSFLGALAAVGASPALAMDFGSVPLRGYPGVKVTRTHVYIYMPYFRKFVEKSTSVTDEYQLSLETARAINRIRVKFPDHIVCSYVMGAYPYSYNYEINKMSHQVVRVDNSTGMQMMVKNRVGPVDREWRSAGTYT